MRVPWRWLLIVLTALAGCEGDPPLTLGLTAEDHEEYFPIAAGAPHALEAVAVGGPISCVSCHGGTGSFAEFKCLSCHSQDAPTLGEVHGAVAGYLPQDVSCFQCHPNGRRDADDGVATHSELSFPIDPDDAHGGAAYLARVSGTETSCTACHADVEDRSITRCAACHAADSPSLATTHTLLRSAFVNQETACRECHAETPVNPKVKPVTLHNSIIDTDHHGARCKDCHQGFLAPPKDWAIDFSVGVCTKCHVAACTLENQGPCF